MLRCPECHGDTEVTGRYKEKGDRMDRVIRYRVCKDCGHKFQTHEVYDWEYHRKPVPSEIKTMRKLMGKGIPCGGTPDACLNCTLDHCVLG